MKSTSSVRVNGLLYSSELVEEKLIFFFSRVGLILWNSVLNWLEEFLENVSTRRSAMAFLPVILWFVMKRCFNGVDCFLPAIFRIMRQTVLMLEKVFSFLT